jgi:GTP cyclohydrolase I
MPSSDPLKSLPPEMKEHFDRVTASMADKMIETNDVLSRIRDEAKMREMTQAAEVVLRLATNLDVNDIHGQDTPLRFVQMLQELTTPEPIKWKTFANDGMDEMVIVKDIPFTSLCNHHVVPFIGFATIGYVPGELVAGLSKFARVVRHFAKGLQVQERLTMQVCEFLEEQLKPRGVMVTMEAEHMCMTIRGVQSPGTKTYTAAVKGVFADHDKTAKVEFLNRINGGHK